MNGAPALIEKSQRRLADAGAHHIGNLIAWNADRIDVTRDAARAVFESVGLASLIAEMDRDSALTRGGRGQAAPGHPRSRVRSTQGRHVRGDRDLRAEHARRRGG